MGCSCKGGVPKVSRSFTWTSEDGSQTQTYPTEVEARARQIRDGGSYKVA